ncbi:MAG: hypothetical protein ACKPJD_02450, partial [Planctomycetaceae bacterium]
AARFTAAEVLRNLGQPDAALQAFEGAATSGMGFWQQSAALEAMVLQSGGDRNVSAALEQWAGQKAAAARKSMLPRFDAEIAPVLKIHCTECHGGEMWCNPATDRTADQLLSTKLWSGVQTRLADHSMPPQGCPPLPIELRRQVMYWIQELPPPDPCEQQLTEERRRRLSP